MLRRSRDVDHVFQADCFRLPFHAGQRLEAGVGDDAVGRGPARDHRLAKQRRVGRHTPHLVGGVSENGAPGLDLGHFRLVHRYIHRAAAAATDDLDRQPRIAAGLRRSSQLSDTPLDRLRALVRILQRQRMPLPGHQPGQPQPILLLDRARQRDNRRAGFYTGTVHADIELDDNRDFDADRQGGRAELRQRRRVVHCDLHVRMALQRGHARVLLRPHHLIGDQNVAHTGRCHHLRFARLRARHPERARIDHLMRNRRYLYPLRVRPPVHAGILEVVHQQRNVALQYIQIHPQRRRIQQLFRTSDFSH